MITFTVITFSGVPKEKKEHNKVILIKNVMKIYHNMGSY